MGFPDGSVVKNPPTSSGDVGSIPGLGRFPEKEMATHSSILAWEIHGQKSLVGATVHGVANNLQHGPDLATKQQLCIKDR